MFDTCAICGKINDMESVTERSILIHKYPLVGIPTSAFDRAPLSRQVCPSKGFCY